MADSADGTIVKTGFCLLIVMSLAGCASQEVAPKVALPEVPKLASAPHPSGYGTGALASLFLSPEAPLAEDLAACSDNYRILAKRTLSRDELQRGVIELIERDPAQAHWCFYSELLKIRRAVDDDTHYIEDLQKHALDSFAYLSDYAQGFRLRFNDTRYLRHTVSAYSSISPRVFYKRVKLTDKTIETLLSDYNPDTYGVFDSGAEGQSPVLEKYGVGGVEVEDQIPVIPATAP